MEIFSAASRHVDWLVQRQAVVASNIANGDTPGFKAKDVTAFAMKADSFASQLAATQPGHFGGAQHTASTSQAETVVLRNADVSHSGNSVSLEQEMKKVGENAMAYNLDMSLIKLFHRMTLTSLKG